MTPHPRTRSLTIEAWLLRGISSIPGRLVLLDGAVSFVVDGTGSAWSWQLRRLEREFDAPGFASAVDEGTPRALFQWAVGTFRYSAPWYFFGGGIRLAHGANVVRLSFGRPAETGAVNVASAVNNLQKVADMRRRGRLWLDTLASAESSIMNEY